MRRKKMIRETTGGIPSHMVVWPLKRASMVTAKQKAKMAVE
jgi:hypothetical protein